MTPHRQRCILFTNLLTAMADLFLPLSTTDAATPRARASMIWDSRDLEVLDPDLTTLCQPCAVG